MDFRQRLSRLFASEWTRFICLTFGILFLLATVVAAAYTGDWYLPGFSALLMIIMLFRFLVIVVFFF